MRNPAEMRRIALSSILAASIAIAPMPGQAGTLSLPDTPLFVSTSVEPNVMLLIDNSGSMNNIIWAAGYNNKTIYPSWGFDATDGNIDHSEIEKSDCSEGWKQSITGKKCLKLPDPVGSGDTRYTGNYLNYLFQTYANDTDLTTGKIPTDYRMNVARTVAANLVNTTTGMRFGVASFNASEKVNRGPGGKINVVCGSSVSTVTTEIGNLTAFSNTPLAETMYEITRYFRGLSSYYNTGTTYTSPIQYRCQKNFTIVITDGMPTYDFTFPTDDPDDPDKKLPNWDGKTPTTTEAQYPNFNQYSDGFNPSGSEGSEGYSLYLDDIAKFGHDIDMKTSGDDNADVSYQDARYPKQNLNTYTIGFAASNQMLEDAAAYGKGKYFTATDAAGLTAALNKAIADIRALSSAAAAVATNSTSLNAGSQVYIAKFNSEFWSGTLLSSPISSAGVIGAPTWNSDTTLASPNAGDRVVVTYKPKKEVGIPFRWPVDASKPDKTELESEQMTALGSAAVLNYLRGDASNEGTGSGKLRPRPNTKLGDIVNSSPQYVGKPVGQYENQNVFRQAYESTTYVAFRNAKLGRTPMVYVGANDGMLHGFNASTSGADKGKELLAYVPGQVYSNLKSLSDQNYTHKYYVDGSPTVADAQVGGEWKTVLVGGLNKGGKGIYALDVTDPATFSEANAEDIVMWEFTDADLGYTFSRPMIVKTNAGWAAVFGNGYNNTVATPDAAAVSTNGYAMLYIVNLSNGKLIKKISTQQGSQGYAQRIGEREWHRYRWQWHRRSYLRRRLARQYVEIRYQRYQ